MLAIAPQGDIDAGAVEYLPGGKPAVEFIGVKKDGFPRPGYIGQHQVAEHAEPAFLPIDVPAQDAHDPGRADLEQGAKVGPRLHRRFHVLLHLHRRLVAGCQPRDRVLYLRVQPAVIRRGEITQALPAFGPGSGKRCAGDERVLVGIVVLVPQQAAQDAGGAAQEHIVDGYAEALARLFEFDQRQAAADEAAAIAQ